MSRSFLGVLQAHGRLRSAVLESGPSFEADGKSGSWERAAFDERLVKSLQDGRFWADDIKLLRSKPRARLATALENLPLPAAFREAAIALRAIIRGARQASTPVSPWLTVMYELAAIESFLNATPYLPEAKEPAFNVIEFIHAEQWSRILRFDYEVLGYDQLTLLNKTDRVWFEEAWGAPKSHTSLRVLHESEWAIAVQRLLQQRKKDWDALVRRLGGGRPVAGGDGGVVYSD